MELHDIGTPPKAVDKWFQEFAEECRAAKTLNPLERIRLNARAGAYEQAAALVQQALWGDLGPFPITLEPGRRVNLELFLGPEL